MKRRRNNSNKKKQFSKKPKTQPEDEEQEEEDEDVPPRIIQLTQLKSMPEDNPLKSFMNFQLDENEFWTRIPVYFDYFHTLQTLRKDLFTVGDEDDPHAILLLDVPVKLLLIFNTKTH